MRSDCALSLDNMIPGKKKLRIGDMLVAAGEITEQQLQDALAEQKASGLKLGRVLIDLGFVEEERFLFFLSEQCGAPFYDLTTFSYDPELVVLIPETLARRYRVLVLEKNGDEIVVGMTDPMDIFAYDEIARKLNAPVSVAVIAESALFGVLDMAYRRTDEIASFASELDGELSVEQFSLGGGAIDSDDDSTPVARLLNSILADAAQVRASDVHIEPDETVLRIRQRVDGVLQEQVVGETRIAAALVSRLKLMADLDISEKRLPQDGRFEVSIGGVELDIRLSTMPVQFGESIVMRLINRQQSVADLNSVGMPADLLERFRFLITRPHGLLLVTGPTGSGKTTTLYGALAELNRPELKIITAEDPVEYQLERINQVQVQAKIGLTFARVLRATLRQDPDVLLVGEIRDRETAEIALRASMTGHLVLSTLHTNDAISSATRLLDMGIDGYLAASSLRGIVAQRLIRRNCEYCAGPATLDDMEYAWLNSVVGEKRAHELQLKVGKGCRRCNNTGFFGRIGVFELLEVDETLASHLRLGDTAGFTDAARVSPGYVPLVMNALEYAIDGLTSIGEVMALAGHEDELRYEETSEGVAEPSETSSLSLELRPH